MFVHGLPDDELVRYRDRIEAVTIEDVQRVAREHIRPEGAAIVLVGDADAFSGELEALGLGEVIVERDEGPVAEGPIEEVVGPVDTGDEGPTVGAEQPQLPGTDEPTQGDDPMGASDKAD